MLIPVGLDGEGLRRWPVVTLTIITLCVLMFVANMYGPQEDDDLIASTFYEAADYYLDHPELVAHPLLRDWLDEYIDELDGELADPTPLHKERQAYLDALTATWLQALRAGPAGRYGWIPGEATLSRVVAHLFVHGDIFHLFFNMLFLYLSAPLIEDAWGRGVFAVFYLVAGFVASALFTLHETLPIPSIGASGAICGVMGALLVRRPDARVRILWWWNFAFQRATVPVWIILPAWAGHELLTAHRMDQIGGSNVAHWAHVSGFGFGALFAAAAGVLGLERSLGPLAQAEHAVLRQVDRAVRRSRYDDAWNQLTRYLISAPNDRDAVLVYWNLAKRLGRCDQAARYILRVVRSELDEGERASALAHWKELESEVPTVVAEIDVAALVAKELADGGADGEADALLRATLAYVDATTSPQTLVALSTATQAVKSSLATRILPSPHPSPTDSQWTTAVFKSQGRPPQASFGG